MGSFLEDHYLFSIPYHLFLRHPTPPASLAGVSLSLAGQESGIEHRKNNWFSPLPCCPPPIFILQPKIIWLKNKMDIQGNPKYRALSYLGICSLEIRKPGPFDGGIYTCKAVNPLGEASVDCRVDVKGKGRTHPLSPQGDNSGMEPQAWREQGLAGSPCRCSRHCHHQDGFEEPCLLPSILFLSKITL